MMTLEQKNKQRSAIADLLFVCGGVNSSVATFKAFEAVQQAENMLYKDVVKLCDGKIDIDQLKVTENEANELLFKHFPKGIKGLYFNTDPRGHSLKIEAHYFDKGGIFEGIGLQQDFIGDRILAPEDYDED